MRTPTPCVPSGIADKASSRKPSAGTRHRLWRGPGVDGRSLALARPRRLHQGGRATLLWALGLYALVQTVLVVVMDRWHPTVFETAARDKWQQLRQVKAAAPDQPLLLMLGSSRTQHALQAGWLNGLPGPDGKPFLPYNFGLPAAGPVRQWVYLRELLDAGIRPRLLLVEVLPPLFSAPRGSTTGEEDWLEAPYLSVSRLYRLWPYLARPHRKGRAWLESRLAPAYAHRPILRTWMEEKVSTGTNRAVRFPHDPWGWMLPHPCTDQVRAWRLAATWKSYGPTLSQFRMGKGPTRAMHDLVAFCREKRIPVVLVTMPESTLFRSWYSPEGRAGPRRLLEELHKAYGVPVIDANDWVEDNDFIDGHHVLARGSWVFTARLRHELQTLLAQPGGIDALAGASRNRP